MHCLSHQKCQYTYWHNHKWLNKITCRWAHFQVWGKILTVLQSYRAVPCEERRVVYLQHTEKKDACVGEVCCEKWEEEEETKEESQFLNTTIEMWSHLNVSWDIQVVKVVVRKPCTLCKNNLKGRLFPKPFGITIHTQYNMSSIYSLLFQYNHRSS